MSNKGFVKIDRSLFDHEIWKETPFSKGQAWIDLIGLANHKDVKDYSGDQVRIFKRGTVNRSVLFLADRWGWSRKKTDNFLKALETDGMLSKKGTTQGTTITLTNYDKFQNRGQRKEQQKSNAGATEEQRGSTNKNVKNDKECKEVCVPHPNDNNTQSVPDLSLIKSYCEQEGIRTNVEKFFAYNNARQWMLGGKPADWKALLALWVQNDKAQPEGKTEQVGTYDFDALERDLVNRE